LSGAVFAPYGWDTAGDQRVTRRGSIFCKHTVASLVRNGDEMTEILSFRDLEAWKAAMKLVVSAYQVAQQVPSTERFELSAQIRRAAVSIPSNIAEGQATGPGGRYRQHVRIAIGSLAELDTQLELAARLGLASAESCRAAAGDVAQTGRLLHGLSRALWRRLAVNSLALAALCLGCATLLLS
jgi:four helix bundle protein